MNIEKSEPERMLTKATQDFNQIINAIFGTDCTVRMDISGVPVSKVAIINESNNKAAAGVHKSVLPISESALVIVHDTAFMPF